MLHKLRLYLGLFTVFETVSVTMSVLILFRVTIFSSILLHLVTALPEARVNSDNTPAQTTCPGGLVEGASVDRGRYWYECQAGQLVPKGCMNEENGRIQIGQSYEGNKNYRLQCVLDTSGHLSIVYKSCVFNGQEKTSGETWEDGKYWFTCLKEGESLKIDVSGCMDNGRRVEANAKVVRGSFVYQCKKSENGTCSMCPVACQKTGRRYEIGDNFENGKFLYTCTNNDPRGPIVIKRIGCVHQGQHLKDGDHFSTNDAIFECSVRKDGAEIRPIGCLQRDASNGAQTERPLDCYWNEGVDPNQYQMTCKLDPTSNRPIKVAITCIYRVNGGAYAVTPGCFEVADKTVVSCEKEESSSSTIYTRIYQIDQIGQLITKGLKSC